MTQAKGRLISSHCFCQYSWKPFSSLTFSYMIIRVPLLCRHTQIMIHSADPQINIFTHDVRTSTFQNLAKQNNFQVKIVIATGGTMYLAEWIFDDTCLNCWSTRPITVLDGSDHYFYTGCLYVRPSQNIEIKPKSLPISTVGYPSGSLMTPISSSLSLCLLLSVKQTFFFIFSWLWDGTALLFALGSWPSIWIKVEPRVEHAALKEGLLNPMGNKIFEQNSWIINY